MRLHRAVRDQRGFTLLELLGVGIILALLAILAVPRVLGAINSTRLRTTIDTAGKMREALNRFAVSRAANQAAGGYPQSGAGTTIDDTAFQNLLPGHWQTPGTRDYDFNQYTSTNPTTFTLCLRARDSDQTYVTMNETGALTIVTTAPAGCR